MKMPGRTGVIEQRGNYRDPVEWASQYIDILCQMKSFQRAINELKQLN